MRQEVQEVQKVQEEILAASNIYQSICMASVTGRKRGISVKELKEKYGMKIRDIKSLISFLNNYDMAEDGEWLYYNIYKLTPHYTPQKDNLPYDELDDLDVNMLDDELDDLDANMDEGAIDIDNDTYIRIEDSVTILREKIKEDNIDITNASFLNTVQREGNEIWNKISDIKMDRNYILIKEERNSLCSDMRSKKMDWIWAVVKGNMVVIKYEIRGFKEIEKNVLPLGMYYNQFLDQYVCVYQDEGTEYQQMILDEIDEIKVENVYKEAISFDIYDYIKSIQDEKMVLHVYKEGNVANKLEKLLSDNQLDVEKGEVYDIFTFMTEDAQQYTRVLKSYGKSVIVVEPDYIRKDMIKGAKEVLEFYQNI